MFCALLGHAGERLQDHWSSGILYLFSPTVIRIFSLAGTWFQN